MSFDPMDVKSELIELIAQVNILNERFDRHMGQINRRLENWEKTMAEVDILMEERDEEKRDFLGPKKLSWIAIIASTIAGIIEGIKK